MITRAALKAAITARELNPTHPVFPTEFWTHPVVVRAVARLDVTTLIRQARTLTPITQEQLAHLTGLTQARSRASNTAASNSATSTASTPSSPAWAHRIPRP